MTWRYDMSTALTKYSLLLHTKEKNKSLWQSIWEILKGGYNCKSSRFLPWHLKISLLFIHEITTQEQTWGMLSFYSQSNKPVSLSHELRSWGDTAKRMETRLVNITKCDQTTNKFVLSYEQTFLRTVSVYERFVTGKRLEELTFKES